jgi:hypothetical protein
MSTGVLIVRATDLDAAYMIATLTTLPCFLVFDVESQSVSSPVGRFYTIEISCCQFGAYILRNGGTVQTPGRSPQLLLSSVPFQPLSRLRTQPLYQPVVEE